MIFFFFFQKNPSLKIKKKSFSGGKIKGGLTGVSEFVLQRIQIKKRNISFFFFFSFFFFLGGGGGGGGGGRRRAE